MKQLWKILFLIALPLVCSCSKDDDSGDDYYDDGYYYLRFDSISASVSGSGETLIREISSNVQWRVSMQSNYNWIQVSPMNGSGNASLYITVAPNTTSSSRSAYIYVAPAQPEVATSYTMYINQSATSGSGGGNNDSGNSGGGNSGGGNSGSGSVSVPQAPTGVSVSNEGNSILPAITVRWNSVSGATGYRVYRSTSANGSYSQIGSETNYTALVDPNPREGTSYYKVRAVNSAGLSDYSSYASINFKANDVAPAPVTYGNCTVSGSTMTLRWTVKTGQGYGTPTKALLRVKNPNNNDYTTLQTLSGTATSVSFTYTPWVDSNGYVYAGIILENDKGSSGGTPKIYDAKNNKWIN